MKLKKRVSSLFLFGGFLFFTLIFSAFFINNAGAATPPQFDPASASPDEIIVKYKNATPENEKENLRKKHKTLLKQKIEKLRVEVVTIQDGTITDKIKQYESNPFVEYAEPNYKGYAAAVTNDTSLPQQWGLFKINAANSTAQSAWDVTQGSPTVKIAILDSGIESTHPDLSGKVVGSANFTTDPTVTDENGHGTHVAGIASATTNNGTGVAGTGYNTSLLNGKVLRADNFGYYSWWANGIVWATDNGAHVINMSLVGNSSSQALTDAVNYAWNKNVVVVVAAGNNNNTAPSYPAYIQNSIAVAATESNDAKASFSTYGSWVDVAAPGASIYSTYKGNSYATLSGTSMASPFAAGTAALIWAKGECATNTCVRQKLESTADKISGTGSLWTWGRINAYNAVSTGTITPTPTLTPTPTITPTPSPTAGPTVIPTATPTPTTTPALTMTVSNITMSSSNSFLGRQISSVITVINESTRAPLATASVKAKITTPTGKVTNFTGNTNSSEKVTFTLRSNEKGTFTTTITDVTKSSYTYHPTTTSQTLLVQ